MERNVPHHIAIIMDGNGDGQKEKDLLEVLGIWKEQKH